MQTNIYDQQKKVLLEIELNYLQLLCVQEVVSSLQRIYERKHKIWPSSVAEWQRQSNDLTYIILENQVVTQLISTSFADKFVPKGYPKETFFFIENLMKNTIRYTMLFEEFSPNQAVSEEKLLFFSKYLKFFFTETQVLKSILIFEEKKYWKKFFSRSEEEYFLKTLQKILIEKESLR